VRLGRWLPLASILVAVVLASCDGRPAVTLRISGVNESVPGLSGSYCQSGGCSGTCADGPAPVPPLVQLHVIAPVTLEVQADDGVTEIRGDIWEGDTVLGRPVEAFTVAGKSARYVSRAMASGHRYYISIHVRWSRPLNTGGQGHAFRVELLPL
jgi:hypothetical protein